MNLEGIMLHISTENLQSTLLGGKIAKIFMPTRASLLILIRKDRYTIPLMADLSGDSPLLYLPDKMQENPDEPPSFCMLLRKHLEEGRINKITQMGLDRVISMEIDVIGPARQIITKKLIFELTGKNSNIIFLENETIIDSLKHVSKTMSSFRQILPNLPYVAPPLQSGFSFLDVSPLSIVESLQEETNKTVLQNLVAKTTGIGKFTATELLALSGIPQDTLGLTFEEKNKFVVELSAMQKTIKAHTTEKLPVYGVISKQNRMKTIVPTKPVHLDPSLFTLKEFPDLNTALNYAVGLVPLQTLEQDLLLKAVLGAIIRAEKKIVILEKDLQTAQNGDQQKIIADTLMSNIYQISKGISSCTLSNIYNNEELKITLSPFLTPVENALAYYKRYNKYKRAIEELKKQILETKDTLAYLQSLDASLQTATSKAEVAEIKQELINEGILTESKKSKGKNTVSKSQPLVLVLSPETTLYVGKNNKQNDFVTFSIAKPRDYWFHTKGFPGSHVVLKTSLATPLDSDIEVAANFSAYFSKARNSSNVPVDFTEKRFVKKPSGTKPGFVIYTNQQTFYLTPDEKIINEILAKQK